MNIFLSGYSTSRESLSLNADSSTCSKPVFVITIGVPSGYSTPAIIISASSGGKKLNLSIPLATTPIVKIKIDIEIAMVLARCSKAHLREGS